MVKKSNDLIDKLLLADKKANSIKNIFTAERMFLEYKNISSNKIIDIISKKRILWKYKDRTPNELGDIDLLAKKLLEIGK